MKKFADESREKSLASHQKSIPQGVVKNTFKKHHKPQNNYFVDYLLQHFCIYFLCSPSKIPLKSVD